MGRTIRTIWGLAAGCTIAWTCLGTHVSLAEDSHVVAESQPAPAAESPPRRWHSFGPAATECQPPVAAAGCVRDSEQPPAPESRRVDSYTGWLISGYLAAPLLFIGVPTATNELTTNNAIRGTSLAIALGGALLLPAIVHWVAGDDDRGRRAALAFPGVTIGSIAVGFLVGAAVSPGRNESGGEDNWVFHAAVGGFIGAGVAWLGWGLFDVIDTNAAAHGSSRARRARSVRVALAPLPGGLASSVTGSF
jgi:hypothetical protein